MLKAIVQVKFSENTSTKDGVDYLEKVLSCGTSKAIAIPELRQSCLCANHEEVSCRALYDYGDGRVDLEITYPYCLAGATSGISELINSLLYCSVFSFIENYAVLDFVMGRTIDLFRGPRIGVLGIREWIGTYQTPLVGVILKPRTKIDLQYQSNIVEELCQTGLVNYIIDDELVVSPACCPFEEKIDIYYNLIERIEQKNGHRLLYWINTTADIEISQRIIEYALGKGLQTFCLNPIAMGFSAVKYLIDKYANQAAFLANNVGRGVISRPPLYYVHERVLAKLSRLVGADAVYTGPISSPFPYNKSILQTEKEALQGELCGYKNSFAVTSGDIGDGKSVTENVVAIGKDVMIQMGGALLGEKASDKLRAFSFIANYSLNETVFHEISSALQAVGYNKEEENMNINKRLLKQKNDQLIEFISKQILLRNEYKQALTTTRDPQETFKYKTELEKCENTIIEFAYELNDLAESNPGINDLDSSNYKVILQIVGDRLEDLDEDDVRGVVSNLDALFDLSKNDNNLDNCIKDKIDEYKIEGSMKNKLELSIPIIPMILNYKMELSADITAKLRKAVLKILQLVRKKS